MIFKNSRKGSAAVEASLLYPILILAIVAVIFIMETLYSHVEESSSLHTSLLQNAGEYAENYEIIPSTDDYYPLERGVSKIKGKCTYEYFTGGMLDYRRPEVKYDSSYILNEKRHMRVSDNVRK